MCFSATASFGASVVLGTIGVATLTKVKERAQVPFAIIPIMFAVQQFTEGILWIGLSDLRSRPHIMEAFSSVHFSRFCPVDMAGMDSFFDFVNGKK
jgi:hypothetical protein